MPWAAALPASVWCTTGAAARPRCRSRSDGAGGRGPPLRHPCRQRSPVTGPEPTPPGARDPGRADLAGEARGVGLEPGDVRIRLGGPSAPGEPMVRHDVAPGACERLEQPELDGCQAECHVAHPRPLAGRLAPAAAF